MRLKKIDSVDAANEFLISYQKEFNQLFALPHNFTTDAFEKQIDNDKINEVLAIVSQRKTDNGGCIKFNNKYYNFFNETGSQVVPLPKTECLVLKKFDGSLIAVIDNYSYILEEFKTHREDSIFDAPIKKEKRFTTLLFLTHLNNKVI